MEISIRAYAARKGISDTAVRKAIKSGRITLTKNGKINPALADRQWEANTDPAQVYAIKKRIHQHEPLLLKQHHRQVLAASAFLTSKAGLFGKPTKPDLKN